MPDQWERLKRQSLGRELTPHEEAFANALERIYTEGIHDFEKVCTLLTTQNIIAPYSNSRTWTQDLLQEELQALNDDLDNAYQQGAHEC